MDKRGTLAVIVIVAAVAVGAAVFIATGTPQGTTTAQDLSGTLEGLEAEQRGETIPGDQPTDELSPGETDITGPESQGASGGGNSTNSTATNATSFG
ncbi:MAG TPA: hypothetical protein VJ742_08630 [Nitrososphaera sp.]|jgi:hypothetical protein|nr:hypothetical protein [Nitrososphaera sp.]